MRAEGGCWTGFWLGLVGAAAVMILAMFGPHWASMKAVETRLKTAVETALRNGGLSEVKVTMDGQTARLTGAVGAEELREKARSLALTAAGEGGPFWGGVTRVVDETLVGQKVSPFSWNAERSGSKLTLTGHVPGADARKRLLDAARSRFQNVEVIDRMSLAYGAPDGDWAAIAIDTLNQLGKLTRGKARLVDEKIILIGEGEQAAVADVQTHFTKPLPAPFAPGVIDLTVEGQGLAIPEIQGVNLSEPNAETCQRAFALIMRSNVIEFASGSATVDPASLALLDNLAAVARRCDQYAIRIAGHTDNVGDPAFNLSLSRARAEAVRTYLAGKGVAPERMQAEGYGQTKPRAPNTNNTNRARNRRIEFNVS